MRKSDGFYETYQKQTRKVKVGDDICIMCENLCTKHSRITDRYWAVQCFCVKLIFPLSKDKYISVNKKRNMSMIKNPGKKLHYLNDNSFDGNCEGIIMFYACDRCQEFKKCLKEGNIIYLGDEGKHFYIDSIHRMND